MVPGATVILTDTDEGAVRTATTNNAGDYQFLDAKADHYKVEIQAPEFERWSSTGLMLSDQQQLRVDAKLPLGSVSTVVNVSGNDASGYNGLTNPYMGASWGDTIPSASIRPIAKQFLQFYPDPNTPANLSGGGTVPTNSFVVGESANYFVNKAIPTNSNHVDARVDQYLGSNQKFLVWGRYSYLNAPSISAYTLNFASSDIISKQQSFVGSLSWTIRPNLINVFLGGQRLCSAAPPMIRR